MKKVKDKLVAELMNHLLVADPRLTLGFLEEVKAHYEKFDEPKMLQEKLYMLATLAMPPKMMVKWLQRWNSSATIWGAFDNPGLASPTPSFRNGSIGQHNGHMLIPTMNFICYPFFCHLGFKSISSRYESELLQLVNERRVYRGRCL